MHDCIYCGRTLSGASKEGSSCIDYGLDHRELLARDWTVLKNEIYEINEVARRCYRIAQAKGFHEDTHGVPDTHLFKTYTRLGLIITEVVEAQRELREQEVNWQNVAEELADIIIRTFDFAVCHGIDIGETIAGKMFKNGSRPYRHGKSF